MTPAGDTSRPSIPNRRLRAWSQRSGRCWPTTRARRSRPRPRRFVRGFPERPRFEAPSRPWIKRSHPPSKNRILKAIRPAVEQCQQVSPEQLDSLRQYISVRCAVALIRPATGRGSVGRTEPSRRHVPAIVRVRVAGDQESRPGPAGLPDMGGLPARGCAGRLVRRQRARGRSPRLA